MAVVSKSSQSEYERRINLSLAYNVKNMCICGCAVPAVKQDTAVTLRMVSLVIRTL